VQPDLRPEAWRLQIGGLVEKPVTWSLAEFMAQPQEDFVSDIHCVTQWSLYDNHWRAVSARHIIDLVRPLAAAKHVLFHSYDGYTTNVRARFSRSPTCCSPIPGGQTDPSRAWRAGARDHSGLVFLEESEMGVAGRIRGARPPGFWEVRGYHNEGDPWKEERYS
jgi:DMSO/TMAO reductase YedYZ molybdopterin-dependent catalytic subunit